MFAWMSWTTPVAVFFICIALMLVGMTVWAVSYTHLTLPTNREV